MHELDISREDQPSKSADDFVGEAITYLITVCGNAEESCPVWAEDSTGERPAIVVVQQRAQSLASLIAHPSRLSQDSVLRGLSVWSDAHTFVEQAP